MNFIDLGIGAFGIIVLLFTIYMTVAFHNTNAKNYGPFVGLGVFAFAILCGIVFVMHNRMQVTEKLYNLHLKLKTECELIIPRSDECIPQYIPEHRG